MAEAGDASRAAVADSGNSGDECLSIKASSSVDLDDGADVDELAEHAFDNEPERRRVLPGRSAAVLGVLAILAFAGYETFSMPLLNAGVYGNSFVNGGVIYYKDLPLDTAGACVMGALCHIADFIILTRSNPIVRRHQWTLGQRLHVVAQYRTAGWGWAIQHWGCGERSLGLWVAQEVEYKRLIAEDKQPLR
eukprot:gene6485-3183_t